MTQKGVLAVVSGFSGAGKGSLMKELLKQHDSYALSISATTRQPREGEVDGREYFFITKERFEKMIAENAFIEYAQYVNNYYGTPRQYVEQCLNAGKDVILEIEVQGAMLVKKQYPDAVTIFVAPPSAVELKNRLIGRGTESAEVIEGRMRRAAEEARLMSFYDYLLVNDDLQESTRQLHELIVQSHKGMGLQAEFIRQIEQELNELNKGE
jgi:guanylate kinase